MSAQFPPSSPLIGTTDFDPFRKSEQEKHQHERGRNAGYPTPNPSSTTGRSSSPARYDTAHPFFPLDLSKKKSVVFSNTNTIHKYGETVAINRDFNILNPDEAVMRIPIAPTTTEPVLIGRSSKSCAYHIETKDKSVSRVHFLIIAVPLSLTSNSHFILKCLGYNGCTVQIPKFCYVTQMSRNHYSIVEGTKPSDLSKVVTNRSIKLDYDHTEFHMNRGESFSVPFLFDNILLDIRGKLLLLNPVDVDEELTDDELPPAKTEVEVLSLTGSRAPTFEIHEDKFKHSTSSPTSASKDTEQDASPKKHTIILEPSTPKQQHFIDRSSIEMEPMTPVANIVKYQEPSVPIHPEILKDSTNTHSSNPNSPYKQKKVPMFRRAHSEEPLNKKPTEITQKVESQGDLDSNIDDKHEPNKKKRKPNQLDEAMLVDRTVLNDVEDMIEIENILINHLAFSRLSSTPASFLRTISKLTQNLSLRQIRVVLHGIECIGVIYRTGKDAAGKPLEEEYYYDLDKDHDTDRPKLVRSIKGTSGLRSCRKTHKQYYWKKPAPIKK
ncbi:uncharacterized protein KQ657_004407 [Scheffersomyces spartinae]|uniref:FHA domain-containing protein n=1 Tax=Scheffersomyces spartinae TaxID=45513 RepID=A0A9P8AIT4_9ASCO|nr:uncharacterized protein KQ657_004407 [Scheffersomyces spartinae]KAG7194728.1 hypothetical protein KQ657_004407 [Scheffersomyces spartinae]